MQTFEVFFSKTAQQNSEIFYPNSPWVCVIKVCSSAAGTCIIGCNISRLKVLYQNRTLKIFSLETIGQNS